MITGRCECGQVEYEVDGAVEDFSHCHCAQCRRLHGAAFATFAGISRTGFRYVSGEGSLRSYSSSPRNDRVFCATCGSNILVQTRDEPDVLYLCMGTVDGHPPLPAGYHAYVASKAPWHEITDTLTQFDEGVSE
jgi:hypothetical protein